MKIPEACIRKRKSQIIEQNSFSVCVNVSPNCSEEDNLVEASELPKKCGKQLTNSLHITKKSIFRLR